MISKDQEAADRICALFLKTEGAKRATYDGLSYSFHVVYPNRELAQQAKSKLADRGWMNGTLHPTWENEYDDPNKDYQLILWVLEAEAS